ncbi:MAG: hypothetical protein ACLTSL_01405 [Odoribacter splanchnicus]
MIKIFIIIVCWCIAGQGYGQSIGREVDKYERKGYFVLPGQASLREQVAAVFKWQALQRRQDSLYYSVTAIARAATYHAAKMQAECRSREELAGKISSRIAGSVHSKTITGKNGSRKAETRQETVSESRTFFEGELGRLHYLLEVMREVGKGEIEVVLVVGYKIEN